MRRPPQITRAKALSLIHFRARELRGRLRARLLREESREREALKYVLREAPAGDAEAVLAALDRYAARRRFLMNVGAQKGAVLDELIAERGVRQALELGSYCGYSAVRIGRMLAPNGGLLVSVERSREHAVIAREIIAHADLSQTVEILIGPSEELLTRLETVFDLVFMDHAKERYLPDLRLLLDRGMLRRGGLLVADNVGIFSADLGGFLAELRAPPWRCELRALPLEYNEGIPDAVAVATWLGP